jgi:hypothetical protein
MDSAGRLARIYRISMVRRGRVRIPAGPGKNRAIRARSTRQGDKMARNRLNSDPLKPGYASSYNLTVNDQTQ